MAITRSGKATGISVGKKIKFLEDGEAPSAEDIVGVSSRDHTAEPESETIVLSELAEEDKSEEEDSDDEAPEEESVSQLKNALLKKMKEQERLEQELRKQEKEKRKQRDLHFKQQQEAKREKIREMVKADKLLDLLPEEALESDDDNDTPQTGKHLRSEDLEKESAELRKKMKLEKLKNSKQMRAQALNKGPVYVQVQQSLTSKNKVPRAERTVLDTKNLWFQRESLNKK